MLNLRVKAIMGGGWMGESEREEIVRREGVGRNN